VSDQAHPPSPCVKVCALDSEQRHCVGCWRSTEEIALWSGMSAAEKHATLARMAARRAARREQMRALRRERQRRRGGRGPG
jgi:predicted Fe-S protein YdhL (DUF1289 family)